MIDLDRSKTKRRTELFLGQLRFCPFSVEFKISKDITRGMSKKEERCLLFLAIITGPLLPYSWEQLSVRVDRHCSQFFLLLLLLYSVLQFQSLGIGFSSWASIVETEGSSTYLQHNLLVTQSTMHTNWKCICTCTK